MASGQERSGLPHVGLAASLLAVLALALSVKGGYGPAVGQEEPAAVAEQAGEGEGAEPSEQPPAAEAEAKAPEAEPQPEVTEQDAEAGAKGEAPPGGEKAPVEKAMPQQERPTRPRAAQRARPAEELDWRRAAIETVVILIGSLVATKAMNLAIRRVVAVPSEGVAPSGQRARTLAGILISTARYVIFLVALLMILASFKINITPLLAGVGFVGLAVGFGARNVVGDIISGFFILFENAFSVGDVVRISGIEGTIEEMGLRSTSVRSYDGTLHIIPNGSVTMISNLSRGYARAVVDITFPNTVDFQEATRVLEEVAKQSSQEVAGLLEPPQVLGIESLSRTEMTIRVSVRVVPAQREPVGRELRRRIKEALQRAGMAC